ncbi:MAG: OmpA family protein [Cyclobacteriaceae bacterium]
MKRSLKTVLFVAWLYTQMLCIEAKAQTAGSPLPPGYYIVVAAYRLHQDSYAKSYMERINRQDLHADYGADLGRKYLYVYLDYYTDFDESIREMLSTRKREGFEKAWVRIMKDPVPTDVNLLVKEDPAPKEVIEKQEPEAATDSNGFTEVTEPSASEQNAVVEEVAEEEIEEVEEEISIEESPITEPVDLAEATVFLSLYNATNNRQVEGEVEVVDTDRARLITKVKGNDYIQLPDPKSKSSKLTLLVNVFGYRPLQHDIDYTHTAVDTLQPFIEWAGNHYLVKFDLVRYHKGDINTLFNVYFYNDAAVMLPESKYQLNNLLTMMKENMHYKIKLHGHTNGKARGKIITMGPSKSFFTLADDVKEGSGSAKELSHQRALVIKDWLVNEGISTERIEVKAWGGGRMLHDEHSVNAKKNVRVDVEILEE